MPGGKAAINGRQVHLDGKEKMALFHPQIWQRQLRDALIYWVYLPVLVLAPGLLIDLLAGLAPHPHRFAGGAALAAGAAIIWRATVDLARYGAGTPSPFRPAQRLVTAGVYRFCRHPMWLGYDLMALGVILATGSFGALLITLPLFLAGQILFLRKEERGLVARFKQGYRAYQADTGMLLPRLRLFAAKETKS